MAATRPRTRAPRVAAPGALRITLSGILAVPDDFGRLRLLLLDERRDGAPDGSWSALRDAVPRLHANYRAPYEVRAGTLGPDTDGVLATATIVLPAHRRDHWLRVAADLRGRWVTVEVTVRPFSMPGGDRDPAPSQGAALDLAMLSPMEDA